jgi:uroporphyrin-III C-methyltransferase
MALKHLDRIVARLVENGRDPGEPAALVASATTARQRILETTLGEAPAATLREGIEPPALFVVGEVVRLRSGLDWLGALAGRRLDPDPLGTRLVDNAG